MTTSPVVVVAGGSAGIGRASAERFASEGYAVAILAREPERVRRAADEIARAHGVETLGIPTDVSDAAAVDAARDAIVERFGHIDVWVNSAMLTVIAPFAECTPEEFAAVTNTTYLGTVNGTRAALAVMKEQGDGGGGGSIVNVGSALAYRSIPLQSAYCAAKHAVNGFTQAVRSELIHEGYDGIHLSLVQLPGVNTPQFDWARQKIDAHPRPAPPVYQPEVAADGVWRAAETGAREIMVGRAAAQLILGNMLAPAALDHVLASQGYSGQKAGPNHEPEGARAGNLDYPVTGDQGAHGSFGDEANESGMVVDGDNARLAFFGGLGALTFGLGLAMGIFSSRNSDPRLKRNGGRFVRTARFQRPAERDRLGYEDSL